MRITTAPRMKLDGCEVTIARAVAQSGNPLRDRLSTSTCVANVLIKRAAADAKTDILLSVSKPLSSLPSMAIETSAPPLSNCGGLPFVGVYLDFHQHFRIVPNHFDMAEQ
jgi:hypothetical protein